MRRLEPAPPPPPIAQLAAIDNHTTGPVRRVLHDSQPPSWNVSFCVTQFFSVPQLPRCTCNLKFEFHEASSLTFTREEIQTLLAFAIRTHTANHAQKLR